MSYDSWLEAPYQRRQDEDPGECPNCGSGAVVEDRRDRTVDCEDCGWHDEFDWDAEAERRAELREDYR